MNNVKCLVAALASCLCAGAFAAEELHAPPGLSTLIQARSIPYARCDLSAPGSSPDSIEVFSDADGFIRLWMRLDIGQPAALLDLDCSDDEGGRDRHSIRVRPGLAIPPPRRPRALRPALAGDPMRVSQKDLHARGFPRRPDTRDARALQRWLDDVSRPAAILSPRRVASRMLNRQTILTEESNNWSGFMIEPNDGAKLLLVEGEWLVPATSRAERADRPWNGRQYSSVWVGLDAGPDIFQAGTQQNVLHAYWFDVTVYNAWIEIFPGPVTVLPDVEVAAGDNLMFRVYAMDRAGFLSAKGELMGFDIHNYTRAQYLSGDAYAKFAGFAGTTAEWVVERQTPVASDGTTLPLQPLPNYGIVNINNVNALDDLERRHDLYTASNTLHKFFMLDYDVADEGVVTSAIQRTGRTSMKFTWIDPAQ